MPPDLTAIQRCLLPVPSAKPPLRRGLRGAGGPAAPHIPRSTLTAERWPGVESSSDFPSSARLNCVVGSASSEPRLSHPSLHPGVSQGLHPCASVRWIPQPQPKCVLTPSQRWHSQTGPSAGPGLAGLSLFTRMTPSGGAEGIAMPCWVAGASPTQFHGSGRAQAHPEASHSPVSRSTCGPSASPFSSLRVSPCTC